MINNKFKENTKVALITLTHVIQKTNIIIALVIKKKKKKGRNKVCTVFKKSKRRDGLVGNKTALCCGVNGIAKQPVT